jgi:hypothetical protein
MSQALLLALRRSTLTGSVRPPQGLAILVVIRLKPSPHENPCAALDIVGTQPAVQPRIGQIADYIVSVIAQKVTMRQHRHIDPLDDVTHPLLICD